MEILIGGIVVLATTAVAIAITARANASVREFRPEAHRSFAHDYQGRQGGGER